MLVWFIIGSLLLGAVIGAVVMALMVTAKRADEDNPGILIGTVSDELLLEWQQAHNVEQALWNDTQEELGLDDCDDLEINLDTGQVYLK